MGKLNLSLFKTIHTEIWMSADNRHFGGTVIMSLRASSKKIMYALDTINVLNFNFSTLVDKLGVFN